MVKSLSKTKGKTKKPMGKVNKSNSGKVASEAKAIRLQQKEAVAKARDIEKTMKTKLQALKADFQKQLAKVTEAAYQKASEQLMQEITKKAKQKAKLLQDAASKFEQTFSSKILKKAPVAKKAAGKKATAKKDKKPAKPVKAAKSAKSAKKGGSKRGRPAKNA